MEVLKGKNVETKTGLIDVNGTRLYYEESGEGLPFVMLHAGVADLRMWDDQFVFFAPSYRAIRYDLRGYGRSAMGSGPYSNADDLHGFLDSLGIEQAVLMGCSLGGLAAIEFAIQHHQRAAALIPVASGLSGFPFQGEPPPFWDEMEAAEEAGDFETAAEMDVRIWFDSRHRTPEQMDPALRARVYEMALAASQGGPNRSNPTRLDPPAFERLDSLTLPLLAIAGDLDDPNVQTIADLLSVSVSNAKKVILSGTAHLPNLERPEEFNRVVAEFLGGLGLQ
jgi:pimeloyl-ACP methyl ester carboxylesterase